MNNGDVGNETIFFDNLTTDPYKVIIIIIIIIVVVVVDIVIIISIKW